MSTDKFFADSNVLLYMLLANDEKAQIVRRLVTQGLTISVQVLNEIVSVMRRKHRLDWSEIRDDLEVVVEMFAIEPLMLETHTLGVKIAEESGLRIYDACIVAAAELAGCNVLYTEDLNHGQRIGRVEIHNPFI
jgi:predicted nucleic acid-binding protein